MTAARKHGIRIHITHGSLADEWMAALPVSAGRRLLSEMFLHEREGAVYARPRGVVPALPAFRKCDYLRSGLRLPSILPRGAAFHPSAPFLHIRSRM